MLMKTASQTLTEQLAQRFGSSWSTLKRHREMDAL